MATRRLLVVTIVGVIGSFWVGHEVAFSKHEVRVPAAEYTFNASAHAIEVAIDVAFSNGVYNRMVLERASNTVGIVSGIIHTNGYALYSYHEPIGTVQSSRGIPMPHMGRRESLGFDANLGEQHHCTTVATNLWLRRKRKEDVKNSAAVFGSSVAS